MRKTDRSKTARPVSIEEKIGHIWAGVFIGVVVVLVVTLAGKGCFFAG